VQITKKFINDKIIELVQMMEVLRMHTNVEVVGVGAPHVGAGLEQGQNFLGVLARDFEALLKSDEKIKEMLKKKAQNGKNWTIVLRIGFYQNNNSIDVILHIQHIFNNDETEWAYLIHAFNTRKDVTIDEYARKLLRNFKHFESKSENIASVVDFNIRTLNLLKNLFRELSVLDWSDGEGRNKLELKIVLNNLADLNKVRRWEL